MTYKFRIYKRTIIVEAQIKGVNDTRGIDFILDTGSSRTVIDDSAAILLGFDLKRLKSGNRLMTAKGSVNSKMLKLPKFSLFGKDLVNFEVDVLNMPSQILFFARGLLGMDFLLQFENIKFDFDKKSLKCNQKTKENVINGTKSPSPSPLAFNTADGLSLKKNHPVFIFSDEHRLPLSIGGAPVPIRVAEFQHSSA